MSAEGPTGPGANRPADFPEWKRAKRIFRPGNHCWLHPALTIMKDFNISTGAAEKRSRLKQKKMGAGWNGGPCRGLRGHATWRGLKLLIEAGNG